MAPGAVVKLAQRLIDMGIDELSISDTIGKATPDEVATLWKWGRTELTDW